VEDELHIVLICPKFQNGRQDLLNRIPNLDELSNDQLFVFLMSAEDDIIRGLQNFAM
jgi:hypothetical protein